MGLQSAVQLLKISFSFLLVEKLSEGWIPEQTLSLHAEATRARMCQLSQPKN
ncbi:hypothetical protein D3C87_383440 [compost metagenome]